MRETETDNPDRAGCPPSMLSLLNCSDLKFFLPTFKLVGIPFIASSHPVTSSLLLASKGRLSTANVTSTATIVGETQLLPASTKPSRPDPQS